MTKLASSQWAEYAVHEWDENTSSLLGFCSDECVSDFILNYAPEYFATNVQVLDLTDDETLGLEATECNHPIAD
jgi:hypothetical protein